MFEESELHQLRRVVREELAALVGRQSSEGAGRTALINTTQAAAAAGVSERTLRSWMKSGKLKRHGQGRLVLVDTEELMRFLSTPEATPGEELAPDDWAAMKQRKQQQG